METDMQHVSPSAPHARDKEHVFRKGVDTDDEELRPAGETSGKPPINLAHPMPAEAELGEGAEAEGDGKSAEPPEQGGAGAGTPSPAVKIGAFGAGAALLLLVLWLVLGRHGRSAPQAVALGEYGQQGVVLSRSRLARPPWLPAAQPASQGLQNASEKPVIGATAPSGRNSIPAGPQPGGIANAPSVAAPSIATSPSAAASLEAGVASNRASAASEVSAPAGGLAPGAVTGGTSSGASNSASQATAVSTKNMPAGNLAPHAVAHEAGVPAAPAPADVLAKLTDGLAELRDRVAGSFVQLQELKSKVAKLEESKPAAPSASVAPGGAVSRAEVKSLQEQVSALTAQLKRHRSVLWLLQRRIGMVDGDKAKADDRPAAGGRSTADRREARRSDSDPEAPRLSLAGVVNGTAYMSDGNGHYQAVQVGSNVAGMGVVISIDTLRHRVVFSGGRVLR